MTPRVKKSILFIALTLATLYTIAWFGFAAWMQHDLNRVWHTADPAAMRLSQPAPQVSGFPGPYVISWSGNVALPDGGVKVPKMIITGWPVPTFSLTVDLPHGYTILSSKIETPGGMGVSFQRMLFTFEVPTYIPPQWTKAEVQKLHDKGIVYRLLRLEGEGPVTPAIVPVFYGSGEYSFDEVLQPQGKLDLVFENADELRTVLIPALKTPLMRSLARTTVTSLMRPDPKTGENVLPLTLSLQKGGVYAGPIRIGSAPVSIWPE